MFTSRENSKRKTQRAMQGMVLAAFLLAVMAGFGADKKKADSSAQAAKRIGVDITKLIWPQPPAVTRLRYVDMYTGEKIDWQAMANPKKNKAKATWKDRLAGTDSKADAEELKLPFQLLEPNGVAADSKGNFFIADAQVGAIFVFNEEKKTTTFIENGKNFKMGLIVGLAMDDNDRLFISDTKLKRVTVLNSKWEVEDIFGQGEMVSPAGVAIDKENRQLYVVDTQLDQVLVYDADSLKLLRKIGKTGMKHTLTDPGNFSLPTRAAVDKDGNLYVTDTLNSRVEVFDPDGGFIREFGGEGDGLGKFSKPKGIAIDCDGHVWVTDTMLNRVQVLTKEGRPLMWFGMEGRLPGQFEGVYDIAIDSQNRVITTEVFPARAQIFQYVTDAQAEVEKKRVQQDRDARAAQRDAQRTGGATKSTASGAEESKSPQ